MSHIPVRSIESWVLEERKCSVCHKPERIPYCPNPVFFFSLVIEPVIELHRPWKSPSPLLHYLLFHSPCDNSDDGRQHFPVHLCNSLLLFHFQMAPWADSQASPQEGHQGLPQPHASLLWASHSALPSSPRLQLLLFAQKPVVGTEASGGVVGAQQGYDAAQTFFTLDLVSDFG